jgi:hypothetical protein
MILREILEDIQVHKRGDKHLHPDFEKIFSNFLVTRYISMMDDCYEVTNYCNQFQSTWSKVQMYKFLVGMVPRRSRYYIKYISKPKVKPKPKKDNTIV